LIDVILQNGLDFCRHRSDNVLRLHNGLLS
jgi:hypothetical protein